MTAVAQLRRALDDLAAVPESAIVDAAKRVERIAEQTGRPITINRKRYPLGAVTKYTRRERRAVSATVFGTPTGFWVWQNTGTRGGYKIAPKRKTAMPTKGKWKHPVSVPVVRKHGIAGRGRWRSVDTRARREVPQIFVDAVHEAIAGVR